MKRKYNFSAMLLCVALFSSCDNTDEGIVEKVSGDAIAFSATTKTLSAANTKAAVKGFPNEGEIGVVAAYYKADGIDWNSYADINNAVAKVSSESSGKYLFEWEQVKYWPFDDTELTFVAYSPVANASSVVLDAGMTSLDLTLEDNMPDVLYASANSMLTPYKKTMATPVDLGEFKHAMSQLTIHLKANALSDVDLISLEITTKKKIAKLDLLAVDDGLTLGTDTDFTYKLVTSVQNIIDNPFEKTVFLYPETEDVTSINFVLKEKNGAQLDYSFAYLIPFFQNTTDPSTSVALVRGKNTTLNITVIGVGVTTPSFILEGSILPWIDKGNFGVIIK